MARAPEPALLTDDGPAHVTGLAPGRVAYPVPAAGEFAQPVRGRVERTAPQGIRFDIEAAHTQTGYPPRTGIAYIFLSILSGSGTKSPPGTLRGPSGPRAASRPGRS